MNSDSSASKRINIDRVQFFYRSVDSFGVVQDGFLYRRRARERVVIKVKYNEKVRRGELRWSCFSRRDFS